MNTNKLQKVLKLTQEYVDMTDADIEDYMDGGDEGWDCGDKEQQDWLNSASPDEIANWIIAGNK